jgi:two-component system, sensor histidine kinase
MVMTSRISAVEPVSLSADAPSLTQAAVAEVAHELRAPLGGIEAMIALLADTELAEPQRRMVQALAASASHLRKVATTILDDHSSRARHGMVGPRDREAEDRVEIGPVLSDLEFLAQARALRQKLTFSVRLGDSIPAGLLVPGTAVRQMLENLLDNAFKVTRSGSICLEVERIGRQGRFHRLRFAVRDSGPGFAAGEPARLFAPFQQVANGVSGTGLGLSLVRRLAAELGGETGAEGGSGTGAIVWFTILVPAATPRMPARPRSLKALTLAVNHEVSPRPRPPLAMIVDDNQASRLVLSVMLEQFGYDVAMAASGREALEKIQAQPPDVIMMDMTMAGMDGVEATRTLRLMAGDIGGIPVVAVTGRVAPAEQDAFFAAGANAFIAKPFSPSVVWKTLNELAMGQLSGAEA